MEAAADQAAIRVISSEGVRWNLATGPAGGYVASLHRLGWTRLRHRELQDDEGNTFSLRLDPPVVLKKAVRASVRRWQLRRLASHLPDLIPHQPDLIHAETGRDVIIDLGSGLGRLTDPPRGHKAPRSCPGFQAEHRTYLRSAAVGGQWPQTRLLQAGWTKDGRCQLCQASLGTLLHRHVCLATRPRDGWPARPAEQDQVWQQLNAARQNLLLTRGFLTVKVRLEEPDRLEAFTWYLDPTNHPDLPAARWYIDGSMVDNVSPVIRRLGFGLVVVAPSGMLIGAGMGKPPAWIVDAAGAELWAFLTVVQLNPIVREVITDCKGILDGLSGPSAALTHPKAALGRTWGMIKAAADDDTEQLARQLRWMPSHVSAARMVSDPPTDSTGEVISWTDWRANRLADGLAKLSAGWDRLPGQVIQHIRRAQRLQLHQAATLGMVTYSANHHKVSQPDGQTMVVRDSCGQRPPRSRRQQRQPEQPEQQRQPQEEQPQQSRAPPPAETRKSKRRRLTLEGQARDAVREAAALAQHVAARQLKPAEAQLTAADRLRDLADRVRARARSTPDV